MNRDTNRLVRELLRRVREPVAAGDPEWFDRTANVFDRMAENYTALGRSDDATECAELAFIARLRAAELRAGRLR